jgi:2-keto-4-pentenoate hydratase/2-oxohepta-3-ene-1,7-dioic acid hydratase in catechol pathway
MRTGGGHGEPCKNVSHEQAHDYVLGYTCANDVSARLETAMGRWPVVPGQNFRHLLLVGAGAGDAQ